MENKVLRKTIPDFMLGAKYKIQKYKIPDFMLGARDERRWNVFEGFLQQGVHCIRTFSNSFD